MSATPALKTLPPPEGIVRRRWVGILIWQCIFACFLFLFSLSLPLPRLSVSLTLLSFIVFHLCHVFVFLAVFLLTAPCIVEAADFSSFASAAFRFVITGGAIRPAERRRAAEIFLMVVCVASGYISVAALCWDEHAVVAIGTRGAVFGLIFALKYLLWKRWLLLFPIIQRSSYFIFKSGLASLFGRVVKLSFQDFVLSHMILLLLPRQFKLEGSFKSQIIFEFRILAVVSVVACCWEMSLYLVQVLHTRRSTFAPRQGSAEAATNPSEILLDVLEKSARETLVQHLAYLDLCIVAETNAETWRRAAFFEESGETFRRVAAVCLRPIEQLTSIIAEGLEGLSANQSDVLVRQCGPVKGSVHAKLYKAFNESQLCSWSTRSISSLIARSRLEDRYGVAQLTGSIQAVITTLLSALLAVEACLGKRTNPQLEKMPGPASIRWATVNSGRGEVPAVASSWYKTEVHKKAHVMADVLRTSIYQIISAFEGDMKASAEGSVLEKNWIAEGTPLFGSRAILIYKLRLFIAYRAN